MNEEITAAIAAHGQWKQRLIDAIDTGNSEFKPDVLKQDNQCAFGKWFYSLPAAEQNSSSGKEIKDLHAKFHQYAGNILHLALIGKKDEARKEIGFGSEYSKCSSQLVSALTKWKK